MKVGFPHASHRTRLVVAAGALLALGAVWWLMSHDSTENSKGVAETAPHSLSRQRQRPERKPSFADSPEALRSWIERRPEEVVERLRQLPGGPERNQAIQSLAVAWAEYDAKAAAAWARGLPDESERELAMLAVAGELMRSSAIDALQLAVELPPGEVRDELLKRGAAEWALADADAAIDWARGVEDTALRTMVLSSAATAWSERDPRAAATLAVEELEVGRLQADAVVAIAQRWVQTDPEGAKAWVEQFPEGPLKEAAKASIEAILSASPP
jgi:hypothetical protein